MWESGVLLLAFYFAVQGAVTGVLWAGAFHIRLWLGAAVAAAVVASWAPVWPSGTPNPWIV